MKIGAWNIARGLSDPERIDDIRSGIIKLDADLVVLPESLDAFGQAVDTYLAHDLGYYELTVPYQDRDPHPSDEQFLTVLSRVACNNTVVRLDTRNGIRVSAGVGRTGRRVELFAVHGDDRSEANRLAMYRSLLDQADAIQHGSVASNMQPDVIIAGDLNSMPAHTLTASILRSAPVRGLARVLPHARLQSLTTRTTEMARGEALGMLEDAGFWNPNTMALPTMKQYGLSLTLDHILHRGQGGVANFNVHDLPGSDHRAISGTVV